MLKWLNLALLIVTICLLQARGLQSLLQSAALQASRPHCSLKLSASGTLYHAIVIGVCKPASGMCIMRIITPRTYACV